MEDIEISWYGNLLVYKKHYTDEFVRDTILNRGLRGLKIFSDLADQRLRDLSFLKRHDYLKALSIATRDDVSFDFLLSLEHLDELSISTFGKTEIDLSAQNQLTNLAIQWRKGKIIGLDNCTELNTLCLVDFKEVDFASVKSLKKLVKLDVKTSSIKSLTGIESFSYLEKLLLGNCRSLTSIENIRSLKNLRNLKFEMCSKVKNFNSIGSLDKLTKLDIVDCKGIESIKFIEEVPTLRELVLTGNTEVLDNDMKPALRIERLFYRPRKSYNIKIDTPIADQIMRENLRFLKES